MNKKQSQHSIFGNSILKNIEIIVVTAIVLVVLTLLFLRAYTRHGQNIIVPKLEGLQVGEANVLLKNKGLHGEVVDSIYQMDAVPGAIVDQTPKPDNKVKAGRAIYLTVYSKNPQQIAIPQLVDYSSRQAIALLNSLGFTNLEIEEVPSQYSGLVLGVEYRGRQLTTDEKIPAGATLKLIVGSGMSSDTISREDGSALPPETTPQNGGEEKKGVDESFF